MNLSQVICYLFEDIIKVAKSELQRRDTIYKPIRNEDAVYKTLDQMKNETNLSKGKIMALAEESKSLIRIDRVVRIRADKFYQYVEEKYGC